MNLKNKFTITLGLCGALLATAAFIPKADDPIDKIVAALQQWTDKNPQEKVYLHTDKPYYALGDTIWFKGYVTVGSHHQLSALSEALYVDLINEKDSLIRSLKLPVTSGMAIGDFTMDDDMQEGSYRLRAYTRWMRNAGEEYFYDKTILVGTIISNNIVSKANYQYKASGSKSVLVATLNYTDDNGKPLANKDIDYQIFINRRIVYRKSGKTDAQGNLIVNVDNSDKVDLRGAYIHTSLETADKLTITRDFAIKANLNESDVQFFPESGNLVNGVTSRVGIKAIGIDGKGIAVKGSVLDNENKEVSTFETAHAGMGSFNLRPEVAKAYTAKVTFADGSTKSIALPKVQDQGYVLGVYQPNKDSILVRINASAQLVQAAPTIGLMTQASGETIIATPVKIDRPMTAIWLEKKDFPSGIAQFTLFSAANEPLAERVAFIRSNDQMQLALKTTKTTYKSKEAVQLLLTAKDSKNKPTFGNFSVSVIDESKVPSQEAMETTILSHLLLTSDLKGYVEQPNYYFATPKNADDEAEINRALDNLMLTQGYRRFTWKGITDPALAAAKPVYEAEKLGSVISGQVINLGKKGVVAGATVNLVSLKSNIAKATTADADGRFKFDGIFMQDSVKFTVQARTPKGSDKVQVVMDTLPRMRISKNPNYADVTTDLNGALKAYITNGKKQDEMFERTGQLDKVQRLREVRINARRNNNSNIATQGMFKVPPSSADQSIILGADADICLTLTMCLRGRIPGVTFTSQQGYTTITDMRGGKIDLIFNGRKVTMEDEVSDLLEGAIMPQDVARIDVVRTNRAMVDFLGGPALLIVTKKDFLRRPNEPSIVNIAPKGFNKARLFYTPKYDVAAADKLPDMRSTIFWKPDVKTDITGQALLKYFNADGPGSYKVIVEGINAEGELGRQVFNYKVEL